MKNHVFHLVWILFMVIVTPTSSQAYTTYLDSIYFMNQGGTVYDSTGKPWSGDDFNGPYGLHVTSPPYSLFGNPADIFLNGDGTVALSGSHTDIAVPNFDSQGNVMTVVNAAITANFRGASPDPNYSHNLIIGDDSPVADYVFLSVDNVPVLGINGLTFGDENNEVNMALFTMPLDGYTSLGLMIQVDSSRNCIPYYWVNPPSGILYPTDSEWTRLGTAISHLDSIDESHNGAGMEHKYLDISVPVPEPSTLLLIAAGLAGMCFLNRKQ
jgi:hypothetical protein